MSSVVAIVKSIVGQVVAVSPEGIRRVLIEGDRLFAGEQVLTGPAGAVTLELPDGRQLDMGRDSQWSSEIPTSTVNLSEATAQAAPSVAELQQAIAAGADPTKDLEATAAGQNAPGGGDAGGGHSFVLLSETAGAVAPTIGFPTAGPANAAQAPLLQTAGVNDTNNIIQTQSTLTVTGTPTLTENGGTLVYTATVTQAPQTDLIVTLSNGQTIVIAGGQTTGTVSVQIPNGNTPYIDPTQISTTITGTSGGAGIVVTTDPTPAVTQITDTIDTTTASITGTASVVEGQSATYTITLSNPAQTEVTINLTYSGTAADGSDYTQVVSVKVPANSSSVTFDIATINDTIPEGVENLTVAIGAITGGNFEQIVVSPTQGSVTTTIIDNDALPVVDLDNNTNGANFATTFTEGDKGVPIVGDLRITDVDSPTVTGATVSLGNPQAGDSVVVGSNNPAITVTTATVNGALVVTLSGAASAAQYEAVIKSITFSNSSEDPSAIDRNITITVNDGQNNSVPVNAVVSVVPVNDAPTAAIEGSISFTEGQSGVSLDGKVTLADVDNATLKGGSVTLNGAQTGDSLVVGSPNTNINVTTSVVDGKIVLTLTGEATKAEYQALINSVTYGNNSENPGTLPRDISVVVNDGQLDSVAVNTPVNVIPVNDAPTVGNTSAAGDEDNTIAVVLQGGDVDGSVDHFNLVTMAEHGKFYSDAAGTTELTNLSDIRASGNTATIYFKPDPDWSGSTQFTYNAVDNGGLVSVGNATGSIVVAPVTDIPELSLGANTTVASLTANGSTTTVAGDIGSGAWHTDNSGDILEIRNPGTYGVDGSVRNSKVIELERDAGDPANLYTNIDAKAGATYTISVDYSPRQGAESNSLINVFWGGALVGTLNASQTGMQTYTFNVPVTSDGSAKLEFKAGDSNSFGGVINNISVTQTLNSGLEDNAILLAPIQARATDIDGSETLTLKMSGLPVGSTLTDGTHTFSASAGSTSTDITDWNLSNLKFTAPSNFSGTVPLTVTATAQDGDATPVSKDLSFDVQVGAVADAPTVAATSAQGTEDTAIQLTLSSALVDTDGSERLTTQIGNIPQGAVLTDGVNSFTSTGGAGGTVIINGWDLSKLTITPPKDFNGVINLTVTATSTEATGPTASTSQTLPVTVTPANDAPILNFSSVEYTEKGAATPIVKDLVISDIDSTELSGAKITLTGVQAQDLIVSEYYKGGETGTAVPGVTYTVSNDGAGNVVIELTGNASIAQYETLINSIKYQNTSVDPSTDVRGVKVEITDADANGNNNLKAIHDGTITVNPVNDAPVVRDSAVVMDEDAPRTAITLTGSDVDGNVSQFRLSSLPEHGTFVDANGNTLTTSSVITASGNSATIYFKPDADWSGKTSFTYSAVDNQGTNSTGTATVDIDVAPVTDKPSIALVGEGFSRGIDFESSANVGNWKDIAVDQLGGGLWQTGNRNNAVEIGKASTYGVIDPKESAGNHVIELESNAGEVRNLYTDIPAKAGATYTISVDYSPRAGSLDNSVINVTWGGVLIGTLNASQTGLKTYTFQVPVTSDGSARLEFKGVDSNSFGGILDNISVTQAANTGLEGHSIALSQFAAAATDTDGSENASLKLSVSGLPQGSVITDGVNTHTITTAEAGKPFDITGWDTSKLAFTPATGFKGDVPLVFTVTTQDGSAAASSSDLNLMVHVLPVTALVLSAAATGVEGSPIEYTVALQDSSKNPVVASADITVKLDNNQTVTILKGQSSGTVSVAGPGDDVYKDGGTLVHSIKEATVGVTAGLTVDNSPVSTLISDTIDTTRVTLNANLDSVNEDGTVRYTATLDHAAQTKTELTLSNGQTIVIDANSKTGYVDYKVQNDVYKASDLTVNVTGTTTTTVNGKTVVNDGNFENLDYSNATVTTKVVDVVNSSNIALTAESNVTEGNYITYTATLKNAAQTDMLITLSNNATITIAANTTSGSTKVYTHDDTIYIDAASVGAHIVSAVGGNFEAVNYASGDQTTQILDSKDTTQLALSTVGTATEGETITYTVKLTGPTGTPVTAQTDMSVTLANNMVIKIAAGQSSGSAPYTVPDSAYTDSASKVSTAIKSYTGGNFEDVNADRSAVNTQITQVNTDTVVTVQAPTQLLEGGTGVFTISVDHAPKSDLTLKLSNGDVVTIKANETSAQYSVSGDTNDVYNTVASKTVTVVGFANDNSGHGNLEGLDVSKATATVNVSDVIDPTQVTITGAGSVIEGASASYVLHLDNPGQTDVVVKLSYSGVAKDGSDFTGVAEVTIAKGTKDFGFNIQTLTDSLVEGAESFTVKVASATGGNFEQLVIGGADSVTTTLVDSSLPTANSGTQTVKEDTAMVLSWKTFGIADPASSTVAMSVKISGLPASGTLEYKDGSAWKAVTAGQEFTKQFIVDGGLKFMPVANESGDNSYTASGVGNMHADYAELGFVPVAGGLSGASSTLKIDITPVADVPRITLGTTPITSTGLVKDVWVGTLTNMGNGGGGANEATIKAGFNTTTAATTHGLASSAIDSNVVQGTGTKLSGLIYLEAGKTYSFGGKADDSLLITIGGKTVATAQWDHSSGALSSTGYTPTASGYYTLDIYHYNQSGPGSYDLNLVVGGTSVALNSSNALLYTSVDDLKASGLSVSGLNEVNGVSGEGYYKGYELNHGVENSPIKLSSINVAYTDNDSETHVTALSGVPKGSVLTDAAGHTVTNTGDTNTQVDIRGLDLTTLTIKTPDYFHGTFNLTVTATATENSNKDVAVTTQVIKVTVDQGVYNTGNGDAGSDQTPLTGSAANDILVGDVSGTSIVQGKSYNIAFILDSSGSMSNTLATAKAQLSSVFDKLATSASGSDAGKVTLMLLDFDTNARVPVTVDLKDKQAALDSLEQAMNGIKADGRTNYEDAFKTAADWFIEAKAANPGAQNLTYFITDGAPNEFQSTDGTLFNYRDSNGNVTNVTLVDALATWSVGKTVTQTLYGKTYTLIDTAGNVDAYKGSGSTLTKTDIGKLSAHDDGKGGTEYSFTVAQDSLDKAMAEADTGFALLSKLSNNGVEAIGIGSGTNTTVLDHYDTSGKSLANVSVDDLAAAVLGSKTAVAPGNDMLVGGDGNDILFGDVINFGGQEGTTALKAFAESKGVTIADNQALHQYITEHLTDVIALSNNSTTAGSNGGNDTLIGGNGNDILFGQGGNDILIGGKGNDILIGGAGSNTFVWKQGDVGTDVVKDFKDTPVSKGGDKLDLSDLLQGEDGNSDAISKFLQITNDGKNTTVEVSTTGQFNSAADVAKADVHIKLEGVTWSNDMIKSLVGGTDPTIKVDHHS
ncbi:retention module-containing protein [Pseudomonas huanghezhanensis]|uniref:retention module-containing protein n=1 Tax=Pseudomonas huanghezhanensis TaxID=3002903 RepID=UPI002285718B|nr:retention module-containing protein [Pseudomonas sp. BSw22131]